MASFRGVDRRFDFKIKNDKVVFLSDYAHHPSEIKQSILSMRALYRDKKLTAVFQPHLYTRTRDFYKDFADSLSLLDEVILVDIYPAREQPIPRRHQQTDLRPSASGHREEHVQERRNSRRTEQERYRSINHPGCGRHR